MELSDISDHTLLEPIELMEVECIIVFLSVVSARDVLCCDSRWLTSQPSAWAVSVSSVWLRV